MNAPHGWQDAIRRVHDESAGLLSVSVIDPLSACALLGATLAGDKEAAILMRAVMSTVTAVERAPRKKPVLCLCCPRAMRPRDPFSICVTTPENGNPSAALGSVICAHCLGDKSTLLARVATALRGLWPDARVVDHVHQAPEVMQ